MNTPANTIKTIKEIPLFQALDKKILKQRLFTVKSTGRFMLTTIAFWVNRLRVLCAKRKKKRKKKPQKLKTNALSSSSSTVYGTDTSMPLLKITSRTMKKPVRYSKRFKQLPVILNKKLFCCTGTAGRENHI